MSHGSGRGSGHRALGAATGLLLDRLLGELPEGVHPLVWFGRAMDGVEGRLWRDAVGAGAVYAAIGNGLALSSGLVLRSVPVATWLCCGSRALERSALAVKEALEHDGLEAARRRLGALVGRDPSALDGVEIASAVVESLAENTVDAVVAPLLFAALGGAPLALLHRGIDTLDSLVGYHGPRYERFGKVSARLDDAAAFVPARLTVLLVVAVRPSRSREILRAVGRFAPAHPSPNAGVAEAAFAGALGLQLCGGGEYGGRKRPRPTLGNGRPPTSGDIADAVALARDVALALAAALLLLGSLARRSSSRPASGAAR